MLKNNIKVDQYKGTWYVIDESFYNSKKVYLLESEQFGEDIPCLIVDKDLKVVKNNVWNGFGDLDE